MNRDEAAHLMTGGQECECYICGRWRRYRYNDGQIEWRRPSGYWQATKLHPGKWRVYTPEPVKIDLPTPAEGCELWKVYQIGITLYLKRPYEVGVPGDPLLGELANDVRWTGRAWWKTEFGGWHVEMMGVLRYEGRPPDYVEMQKP